VRVVHHAHERTLLCHLRQQPQRRQADQKSIRRRPVAEPEGGRERVVLWTRESLKPIQHRRAELMQRRERKLPLGLDSVRTRDLQIRR
jgi:hypothetical protein